MTVTYAMRPERRNVIDRVEDDYATDPLEHANGIIAAMRSYVEEMQSRNLVTRQEGRDIFTNWKADYLLRLLKERE